jgi:DNA processing protein
MGSGLDIVYPAEHRGLAGDITGSGALVGEYPLGVRPRPQNFPRRNRIISGLALGVLVVEASETSGAMWTVRRALDQGREVFAVPGSIFSPVSRGVNRLAQDGAKLVMSHTDVLEALNLSALGHGEAHQQEMPGFQGPAAGAGVEGAMSPEQDALLSFIGHEPVHIDEVCRSAGVAIASVSSALAILEIQGVVKQVGAMHYVRVREAPAAYQAVP